MTSPERQDAPALEGLYVGDLFHRYRPQRELGRGPLATIYRAIDKDREEAVALKLFDARFRREPRFAIRFRQHLRAVVGLEHPNLARVLDYGLAGNHFYIVNELVEGMNLATLMAERGVLSPGMAAEVARQICLGLSAAHEYGLVHRNLKPENVLLSREGQVKVVDVGLSGLLSESGLSRTSVMLHGVDYMAPEQGRGQRAGPAADVYSVGVILFEMLADRPPFVSEDVWRVVQMHLQTPPPSLRRLNPNVSVELQAVVARALSKEPGERFASAGDMAAALAPLAADGVSLELPATPPPPSTERSSSALPVALERARRQARGLLAELRAEGGPRSVESAGLLLALQFVISFALTFLLLLALTGR